MMSGFFSIAETSMMALNRYRLKHMVAQGDGGAGARATRCCERTRRGSSSTIQIGITSIGF